MIAKTRPCNRCGCGRINYEEEERRYGELAPWFGAAIPPVSVTGDPLDSLPTRIIFCRSDRLNWMDLVEGHLSGKRSVHENRLGPLHLPLSFSSLLPFNL